MINLDINTIKFDESGVVNFAVPYNNSSEINIREGIVKIFNSFLNAPNTTPDQKEYIHAASKWLAVEVIKLYQLSATAGTLLAAESFRLPEHYKYLNWLMNDGQRPGLLSATCRKVLAKDPGARLVLKKLARSLQWNWKKVIFNPIKLVSDQAVCMSHSPLTISHADATKRVLSYRQLGEFFAPFVQNVKDLTEWDRLFLAQLKESFFELYRANSVQEIQKVSDYLADWIEDSFTTVIALKKSLKKEIIPSEIRCGNPTPSLPFKILLDEVRCRGGKVLAHDHGGGNAYIEQFQDHFAVYQHCDVFVAFNKYGARKRQEQILPPVLLGRPEPEFISSPFFSAPKATEIEKPISVTKKIKKIMYTGTAFHGEAGRFRPILSDVVYFDWQVRLLSFLKAQGYFVYYKPHPEGYTRSKASFAEEFGFSTINKRFEEVDVEVDAYLIDFVTSSTTPAILNSKLPVFFIDPGFPKLIPEAKEQLSRRCYYHDVTINDQRRISIDWDLFEKQLKNEEHLISYEFCRHYYY
jgi:hypothetical protein